MLLAVFSLLLFVGRAARRERARCSAVDPAAEPFTPPAAWSRRATWCWCGSRTTTASSATARPRRFEPYDGVTIDEVSRPRHGGGARPAAGARGRRDGVPGPGAPAAGGPVGEPRPRPIAVNHTLAAGPPEEVGGRARAEGAAEGYACFKLKVGLTDDEERVAAVRDAIGPDGAARGRQRRVDGRRGGRSGSRQLGVRPRVRRAAVRNARELAEVRARSACRSPPTSRSRAPTTCAAPRSRGVRRREVKLAPAGGFRPPASAARARSTRARRVPLEHARRTLGHRRLAAAGLGARARAGLRPGDARAVRRPRSRARCRRRATACWPCRQGPGLGIERRRRRSPRSAEVLVQELAEQSATSSGPSSCGAWPAPRRSRARAGGHDAAIRARPPSSASSCSPASASSGSSSACSSSQTGSSAPWPAVRSSCARRARVVVQPAGALRLDQRGGLGGEHRLASQRATTSSIGVRLDPGGQLLVGLGARCRARASSMPADAPTVTSPANGSGSRSAACSASRPPIE